MIGSLKMTIEERTNRLNTILNQKLSEYSTKKGKIYSAGSCINLHELFRECCNHFYTTTDDYRQVCRKITEKMPHLQEQRWLIGMTEDDKSNFIDIIAKNEVPLTLRTWVELCNEYVIKPVTPTGHLKLHYWLDPCSSQGNNHFINFTVAAATGTTFYEKHGWYIGATRIGVLTSKEAIQVSDKGDFCVKGYIVFDEQLSMQEVSNLLQESCKEKLERMKREYGFNADESAIIDKLDLSAVLNISEISNFLTWERGTVESRNKIEQPHSGLKDSNAYPGYFKPKKGQQAAIEANNNLCL